MLDRISAEIAFAFRTAVRGADENAIFAADGPVDVWGVHGGFDVCAVEIRGWCAGGVVDEFGGEGEDVPEEGALLVDLVDVEARVIFKGLAVDQIEDVAGLVGGAGVIEVVRRLDARGWKSHVFGAVVCVAAGLVETFELGEEGAVEAEHVVCSLDEGDGDDFFLDVVEVADAGVVNEGAAEVEVCFVFLVQHCGGDVGDVAARVAFAGDVDFEVLDAEEQFEIFEEVDKV